MDMKATETARKQASVRNKNIRLILSLLRKQPNSTFGVGQTLRLSSGGAKKLVDDIAAGGIIAPVPANSSSPSAKRIRRVATAPVITEAAIGISPIKKPSMLSSAAHAIVNVSITPSAVSAPHTQQIVARSALCFVMSRASAFFRA